MRSFTKKNPPINNSIKELVIKNSPHNNINTLVSNLKTPPFTETNSDLINLADDDIISSLIEKNRDTIKQKLAALNIVYVKNFNTHFTNANFPGVDVAKDITPYLKALLPSADSITKVLTAAGTHNNLNVCIAPYSLGWQTAANIGTLLALDQLMNAAGIRNSYTDARYDQMNVIDPARRGDDYGKSKPHLVKLSGLYCAYCESKLSDGAITNVEHKIPKSSFPTLEKNWENFVLACERCNTGFKSNRYVHPEGIIAIDKLAKKAYPLEYAGVSTKTMNAFTTYPAQAALILETIMTNIADGKNVNRITLARKGINDETTKRTKAMTKATAEVNAVFKKLLPGKTPDINTFCGGATFVKEVTKDFARMAIYFVSKKYAEDQIVWPDRHYTAGGMEVGKRINSFQAYAYKLVNSVGTGIDIELHEIGPNTDLQVDANYHINLKKLIGRADQSNVKLKVTTPDFNQLNTAGNKIISDEAMVEASVTNMLSINGLNELHSIGVFLDQRIIRRTRAWLQAMKMLKQLSEFKMKKYDKLSDYYQRQLHPVNIKYNTGNLNNVAGLRDDKLAAIVLDSIVGEISINSRLPNGKINIKLTTTVTATTGSGTKQIIINNTVVPSFTIKSGVLTGEIKVTGSNRFFTGSLEVNTLKNALTQKIILIKDAPVSNPTAVKTEITIGLNQGVISNNAKLGTAGSPAEIIKEWDSNRASLMETINQTTAIMKEFMWDNILNMVRIGGFYSTWVRTFQNYSTPKSPFDIDLVRKLDIKAKENPEDPYQFHGTDVEEIIAAL